MGNRIAAFGLVLLATINSNAAEFQYSVAVDNRPAGEFSVIFKPGGSGTEVHARIKVDRNKDYQFQYEGTELWKKGRLVRLDGTAVEMSQKRNVSLVDGKAGYALKSGIKEVTVRGEVWPTTYWMRPDVERPHIVTVPTGEVSRAKIASLGPDHLQVDAKLIHATRFRVTTTGASTELWYDAANRLVRRKWERNGRSIVIELVHIKSN